MTAKIQVLVKTDQMKLSLIFIIINFSYLYQSSVIHHLNLQKRNNSTFVRQWTIQNTVLCGLCNPRGNNFMMSNGNDFYLLWGGERKNFWVNFESTHHLNAAEWNIQCLFSCIIFIPFKLGSNPQHLSQRLFYNILLFSSDCFWIWINKI